MRGKARTVPIIDDEFLSDLKHLLDDRTSGPVFAGPSGKPLITSRINYIIPRVGEAS